MLKAALIYKPTLGGGVFATMYHITQEPNNDSEYFYFVDNQTQIICWLDSRVK